MKHIYISISAFLTPHLQHEYTHFQIISTFSVIRLANCDNVIKFTHFPFFSSSKDSPNLGLFHVCHDNIPIFLRRDQHCLSGVASNPSGNLLYSLDSYLWLRNYITSGELSPWPHFLSGVTYIVQWSRIQNSVELNILTQWSRFLPSLSHKKSILNQLTLFPHSLYSRLQYRKTGFL